MPAYIYSVKEKDRKAEHERQREVERGREGGGMWTRF